MAGRYRLRALLGRGGMGRVWLVEDELLHRSVALKQDLLSDPASGTAQSPVPGHVLTEARAPASVNHHGAVTIYDVVVDDGHHWIVMEPLFGRTLAEAIAGEGHLSVAQVTAIGIRLLDVLEAAHRVGILHCDVKPANVHICSDGRVVLTDFGIARRMMDETGDNTQVFAASPVYAAPERLRGGPPSPRPTFSPWVRPCSQQSKADRHSLEPHSSTPSSRSSTAIRRRSDTPDHCNPFSRDCSRRTPQTGSPRSERSWHCRTSSTNISSARDGRTARPRRSDFSNGADHNAAGSPNRHAYPHSVAGVVRTASGNAATIADRYGKWMLPATKEEAGCGTLSLCLRTVTSRAENIDGSWPRR